MEAGGQSCKGENSHLPTAREYVSTLEAVGMEVLEHDELVEFHKLWTASSPPSHSEYAHVFYDEWGGGGGDPREHHKEVRNAFQCIGN